MSRKTVSLMLLSILLLLSAIIVALAQPVVGVNEGDWFKHGEIVLDWNSNDTGATFPPYGWEWLAEWNETEWLMVTVESISGTNITSEFAQHFNNGSDKIRAGWLDIDTGTSGAMTNETMDMTFMFISANLGENDSLYFSGVFSQWTINETIIRNYPDTTRETNHLNLTMEYSYSNGLSVYFYQSMNYYWDKPTGILVEWSIHSINQTGQYLTTWSVVSKVTESSIWIIPEFHATAPLILGVILATLETAFAKRKLLKPPIH